MATSADQKPKRLYEFGPFRVDPEKELLLRDDEAVPLAPKAFQVLLVLMKHKREVVTKDELLKAVWPDTFVEETNLSRNIFLLRKALGESPQDHQYIITVPGRGYRFAEDVQFVPEQEQELNLVAASHSKVQVQVKETRLWGWIVAAVLLVALAVGAYRLFVHRSPVLTEKDTVVLADFANSTGNPVFDGTLRQGLAVQLEQSPFLKIMDDEQVQRILRLMGLPPDARITNQVAHEICVRQGAAATIDGTIASLGKSYVITLQAIACREGTTLAREQVQAVDQEHVLDAVGSAVTAMRGKLGESLTSIQKLNRPLEQATTSSLEALKAYSDGRNEYYAHGGPAAVPHLQRAIAIDPQFAMAYGDLAMVYWNMGQTDLSAEYTRKAYAFRDRVSDRERLWILFLYDRQVTGNLPRELQTLQSWIQTYPHDWLPYSALAGWGTLGTGQYERGLHAAQEALRLNPDSTFSYIGSFHNFLLDRFAEAADALQRAAERKLEIPQFLLMRYYIAFLKGDQAGMEREIARAREEQAEDWMSHNQAMVLARSGQMRQARAMWERAVAMAQQAGNHEGAARYEVAEAVCEARFGNATAAKERARAALQLAKDRDVEYAAAFALALSGDSAGSQGLAGDLEKRFPEDTPVQFEYLPTLHALSALSNHQSLDAVERLQRALPYDFALPGTAFFSTFGGLYPAYVRGEAYLQAQHGREAVAEFQKVLDHRGIVFADPIGALAHLQLGRAYAMSRDNPKAKHEYQQFLTLWKDADPDIPIFKQARAEYARLN
jgi:eukaryotic-like serine/threonine-protein kinase